ncbi:MAG: (2Fe-2S) ferredoxin domain-containing protein [Elioraea sp.]|nr:(2Fe-2S) ferredoxin domain-containing protein [Elioraea sp.]
MTEGAPLLRSPEDPPLFYRAHVFVCCNRRPEGHARGSCAARGSEDVRAYMKARVKELGLRKVRVNQAGCLDRCEAGPCIVIYPEGVWYRIRSREDAERVIQEHLVSGRRAVDLMLDRELAMSCEASGDADG